MYKYMANSKKQRIHFHTVGVVQDCHNSLISVFLIFQLDLLPTRSHSRSFKLEAHGRRQTISADSTTLYLTPQSELSLVR